MLTRQKLIYFPLIGEVAWGGASYNQGDVWGETG